VSSIPLRVEGLLLLLSAGAATPCASQAVEAGFASAWWRWLLWTSGITQELWEAYHHGRILRRMRRTPESDIWRCLGYTDRSIGWLYSQACGTSQETRSRRSSEVGECCCRLWELAKRKGKRFRTWWNSTLLPQIRSQSRSARILLFSITSLQGPRTPYLSRLIWRWTRSLISVVIHHCYLCHFKKGLVQRLNFFEVALLQFFQSILQAMHSMPSPILSPAPANHFKLSSRTKQQRN